MCRAPCSVRRPSPEVPRGRHRHDRPRSAPYAFRVLARCGYVGGHGRSCGSHRSVTTRPSLTCAQTATTDCDSNPVSSHGSRSAARRSRSPRTRSRFVRAPRRTRSARLSGLGGHPELSVAPSRGAGRSVSGCLVADYSAGSSTDEGHSGPYRSSTSTACDLFAVSGSSPVPGFRT